MSKLYTKIRTLGDLSIRGRTGQPTKKLKEAADDARYRHLYATEDLIGALPFLCDSSYEAFRRLLGSSKEAARARATVS